jgi:hypothetical protein
MNSLRRSIIVVAAATLIGAPGAAIAQKPVFHPGLGDLMTAFVQPRHTKLGLAGSVQNWAYAAYELNELSEAFDDVAEIVPKYRNLSVPELIGATIKPAIAALDQAIKAKDSGQFTAAYGQLTASCNACHQSTDHAVIVIQPPTASSFPDQDFRAPSK